MKNRIVFIPHSDHHHFDRASDHLGQLGFQIDWKLPFKGDVLGTLTDDVAGTIVFGGKYCTDEISKYPFLQDEISWLKQCMDANIPTLGICQGAQMIAHILGAKVGPHPDGIYEFGYYPIEPVGGKQGFLNAPLHVAQSHFHTYELPSGAVQLAKSDAYEQQAFQWGENVYGFQFHPEATPRFIEENWLSQPWAAENSKQPNAQSFREFRRLGSIHEPALDRWFRNFLTNLFGPID